MLKFRTSSEDERALENRTMRVLHRTGGRSKDRAHSEAAWLRGYLEPPEPTFAEVRFRIFRIWGTARFSSPVELPGVVIRTLYMDSMPSRRFNIVVARESRSRLKTILFFSPIHKPPDKSAIPSQVSYCRYHEELFVALPGPAWLAT